MRMSLGWACWLYSQSPAVVVSGVSTVVTTAKASTSHTNLRLAAGHTAHSISSSAVNGARTTMA